METDEMLAERGERYGDFTEVAETSQRLKDAMSFAINYGKLMPEQVEALGMIAHKIARILNGDPNYVDSWADIAGYAQLVVQRLEDSSNNNDDDDDDEIEAEAEPQGVSHKKVKKAFRTLMRAGIISPH